MARWLLGTGVGNVVMLAVSVTLIWSAWTLLRWHRDRGRYGDKLERAVRRELATYSPRTLARTAVAACVLMLVMGISFAVTVVGYALVRWSVLPADETVALDAVSGVPALLGLLTLGVMRLTGPPRSMRLVPRDPTSRDDLLRQLAEASAAARGASPDPQAPTTFVSNRTGSPHEVHITVRPGVPGAERRALVTQLRSVPWAELRHAHGRATDVPALLYAATVGTDAVRRGAWWELWGNIHHQGTVYEVTPRCVVYLAKVAADPSHPDRVNALEFLRTIAVGEGQHAPTTRAAVAQHLPRLVAGWQDEPELVRRALLLLMSAFPDRLARYPGLTDELPDELQPAWAELMSVGGHSSLLALDADRDDLMDRQDELERWALAGWYEPAER